MRCRHVLVFPDEIAIGRKKGFERKGQKAKRETMAHLLLRISRDGTISYAGPTEPPSLHPGVIGFLNKFIRFSVVFSLPFAYFLSLSLDHTPELGSEPMTQPVDRAVPQATAVIEESATTAAETLLFVGGKGNSPLISFSSFFENKLSTMLGLFSDLLISRRPHSLPLNFIRTPFLNRVDATIEKGLMRTMYTKRRYCKRKIRGDRRR